MAVARAGVSVGGTCVGIGVGVAAGVSLAETLGAGVAVGMNVSVEVGTKGRCLLSGPTSGRAVAFGSFWEQVIFPYHGSLLIVEEYGAHEFLLDENHPIHATFLQQPPRA